MGLRIELSETGGIANLHRLIALDGNRLRVLERRQVCLEHEIADEAVRGVVKQARALQKVRPRRSYGKAQYVSDALILRVAITDDTGRKELEVIQDPKDPAPPQFWNLVQSLRQVSRPTLGLSRIEG